MTAARGGPDAGWRRDARRFTRPGAHLLAALGLALAAVLVWHRALDTFFCQDDFVGLGRAAGILPRLAGPWRLWSNQLHFDLLLRMAGLDPWPYHLANLVAHAGAAAALGAFLARRVSHAAAFAAAAFFVTHPASFTALHWASAIGDPLALALALAALLSAEGGPAARRLSPVWYAAALLAKESVVLLPLAAIAIRHLGPPRGSAGDAWQRRPVLAHEALMLGIGAAYLAAFVAADIVGVRSGAPPGSAYALGLGREAGLHLLTLLGWAANPFVFTYPTRIDAIDPAVFPWAIGLIVLVAIESRSAGFRARGGIAATALVALMLAPVLPLAHHVYRYFLVAPLAGVAWWLAAALDPLLARARGRVAIAALLALAMAVNGALVVGWLERAPSRFPGLLAEPVADRSRIARRVIEALRAAAPEPGTPILFLAPRLAASGRPAADGAPGLTDYAESNLRVAIADSLAIRLFVPQAGPVAFVRAVAGAPAGALWVLYHPDGTSFVGPRAALDSLAARATSLP